MKYLSLLVLFWGTTRVFIFSLLFNIISFCKFKSLSICGNQVKIINNLVQYREITQRTFYVLLTSQDQARLHLQVLLHFLASKSLF